MTQIISFAGVLTVAVVLLRGCHSQTTTTYWTAWLDRDNPGGVGDFETTADFKQVCREGEEIIGIECRRVGDHMLWHNTGEVFVHACVVPQGLACRNEDQPKGRQCSDYEVRFLCQRKTQDLCKYCCPAGDHVLCSKPVCESNADCPDKEICCSPALCKHKVCVKRVECCCPNEESIINPARAPCRHDYDCSDHNEKCCWAGDIWKGQLMCRRSVPCPCNLDLCCPYTGTKPNPTCQQCSDDSQCPDLYKCCVGREGCKRCVKGVVNGPDCKGREKYTTEEK